MGFMVARFLATYPMPYEAVMRMPVRAFFSLSEMIVAVRAEKEMVQLQIAASAQSGEAVEKLWNNIKSRSIQGVELTDEAVMQANSVRDADAGERLRRLAG